MRKKGFLPLHRRFVAAILPFILALTIIPSGTVLGVGTQLKTGNYIYSPYPDAGSSPDRSLTGLISSDQGVLFNGVSSTYAAWMGSATSAGTVKVAIDLLKDYPLDRIRVVLNSPNSFWGFKELTVKYRPEAASGYYIATRHARSGTDLNYAVTVPMSNHKARFIILEIKRTQPFQHIPLTEVEIYRGAGDEGQNPAPAFTADQLKDELKKEASLVDAYGQWASETWEGKVTSDEQLRQEYADEAKALANVSQDPAKYDAYGGIKSMGRYESTGYFRLQKIDGKWWFITPDGYPFIVKGVDAASLWETGYKTLVKTADGTPRQVFAELPDRTAYSPAYSKDANGESLSFVVANVMKKYGSDYEAKWEEITKKRLIDWGFNTFSKWTKPKNITLPYIQVLQDPSNLRRIQWTYDVFDPQSGPIIENALKAQLQNTKSSKWLIGYSYDNEAGWTTDIVKQVLAYSSVSPAKNAFVDFLAPRYSNNLSAVNQLLGTSVASFEALKDTPIDIAKVPAVDVSEYIRLASRTYYSTILGIIKKYDTNHLFLGTSVVPTWRTCLDWDQPAMEYVDVFSVDSYAKNADWIAKYEAYGKPLLNQEYSFSASERGMSYPNAAVNTGNITQRGAAFKSFAESQAAHPLFVGSGWFGYFDQPATGRTDGENYNVGLVNQQDQPYPDLVNAMKTVHAELENVHANGSAAAPVRDPIKVEAENFDAQMGITVGSTVDGGEEGRNIGSLGPSDWAAYGAIDLTGMKSIDFRVGSTLSGTVRVRLGSASGTIIGTLKVSPTGGWHVWKTSNIAITPTVGTHNLYLTFESTNGQDVANINYFMIKP